MAPAPIGRRRQQQLVGKSAAAASKEGCAPASCLPRSGRSDCRGGGGAPASESGRSQRRIGIGLLRVNRRPGRGIRITGRLSRRRCITSALMPLGDHLLGQLTVEWPPLPAYSWAARGSVACASPSAAQNDPLRGIIVVVVVAVAAAATGSTGGRAAVRNGGSGAPSRAECVSATPLLASESAMRNRPPEARTNGAGARPQSLD
jgi:hypothetical protein